jgi:hypothetical protein
MPSKWTQLFSSSGQSKPSGSSSTKRLYGDEGSSTYSYVSKKTTTSGQPTEALLKANMYRGGITAPFTQVSAPAEN